MGVRVLGIAGLCMLLVTVSACSGEDEAQSTSTTASTSTSLAPTTTALLTDDEFVEVTESLTGEVDAAAGDFCALMDLVTLEPVAQPNTPEQVEAAVMVLSRLFDGLARADGVDAESAAVLDEMAQVLPQQAEASGWSVDFLISPETAFVANETYVGVLTALGLRASEECTSTTDEQPVD